MSTEPERKARERGSERNSEIERERDATPPEMDDPVDEAAAESFPASDPPAFTRTHAGDAARGRAKERLARRDPDRNEG